MEFKIKKFFIPSLSAPDRDLWGEITFDDDDIVKRTDKAFFLKSPLSQNTAWVPIKCIEKVSTHSIEDAMSFDANSSTSPVSAEIPENVKKVLDKCLLCGNYANGNCKMYNTKTQFALLLCLQNDVEAIEGDLDYANHRISELEKELDDNFQQVLSSVSDETGKTPFTF